jgi:hypothetical protein
MIVFLEDKFEPYFLTVMTPLGASNLAMCLWVCGKIRKESYNSMPGQGSVTHVTVTCCGDCLVYTSASSSVKCENTILCQGWFF